MVTNNSAAAVDPTAPRRTLPSRAPPEEPKIPAANLHVRYPSGIASREIATEKITAKVTSPYRRHTGYLPVR